MPDPLVVQLANQFREQLDGRANEAIEQMAGEWLKVEERLKADIELLAAELAAAPGEVKLSPMTETVKLMQEAGYAPDYILQLLATQGIFEIPEVPQPQAKQLKDWQLAQLRRYVRLLVQVQAEIARFTGQTAAPIIEQLQADAAYEGIQNALTMIEASVSSAGGSTVDLAFDQLNTAAVENIVAIAGAGRPLGDLLQAAYPLSANGITNELVYGTAKGQNPRKTARSIIENGLAQGLNHMLLVARDQQVRAVRESARQQYARAGIEGYRRLAAKQARTCLACLALDGTIWPTSELMALHPQDRCSMLPLVPGFEPVQFETGPEWFMKQPASVQKEMMGPGKYELWKAGGFEFDQLATIKPNRTWGPSAQVTTLKDLQRGRGGFRPPGSPTPAQPRPPTGPVAPGPSPLPGLDHEALMIKDLHQLGPDWGEQTNWKNQSYGGILFDDQGRVLLRKPTGEFGGYAWTFPKGKMNNSKEHPVQTALMEVEEETGHDGQIIGLVPGQFKGDTGQTNFFLMKSNSWDRSLMDDETERLVWATPEEAKKLIRQGANEKGVKRDLAVLEAATKAHGDLLSGEATNDYLFDQKGPVVITNFSQPLLDHIEKQAGQISHQNKMELLVTKADIGKSGTKGIVVLDSDGSLKALATYDDKSSDYVYVHNAWGDTVTNGKTLLINLGQIAAKDGRGIILTPKASKVKQSAPKVGYKSTDDGGPVTPGSFYLESDWMKEWKKAPTKFKPPSPRPLPPEPKGYDRKTIPPTDAKLTGEIKELAQADFGDPLALKGAQVAADKIAGGQKGFMYASDTGKLKGVISYEEQGSIIKVGSAGFSDFETNLAGLQDVVKIAKQAGKDFVTFAPKGPILDQYLKWGFEVNTAYGNGASLILKKQNFDEWLGDPAKYGKEHRSSLEPTPSGSYSPPPQPTSSGYKATPRPRDPDPLPDPAPLPDPDDFPPDPAVLTVVRKLGGSTGAELVEDVVTGRRYVRKRGGSPDHILEEVHADAAYQAAGANVPRFKLYDTPAGPVKLAEFIEGEVLGDVLKKGGARAKKAREAMKENFGADALFGNRDVIGADYDNVLVDKSGRVWRIDNGGSFRFRAMGERKTDWDDYPLEFWSMRDKQYRQVHDLFGDLDFYSISDQVMELKRRREAILAAVPEEVRDVLDRRLRNITDMATTGQAMQGDDFQVDYADGMSRQRMEMRKGGLTDQMPLAMGIKGYEKASAKKRYKGAVNTSAVYDEQGRQFDRLRGGNSLIGQLKGFVNKAGGNYDLVVKWASEQAGSSWSPASQALKYHVVQQMNKAEKLFWWRDGKSKAEKYYKSIASDKAAYDKTFQALHAFTQEMLTRMDLPNKTERDTIFLLRSEASNILSRNGIKPGDTGATMPRGAIESTSVFGGVYIGGSELTRQEVPLHRIIAPYFMERVPGSGVSMFYGDNENEFVVILGGDLPFDYVGRNNGSVVID
jgi:8-oxo-dGTP pyrophosphatase MutT (NUDIX family)